MKITQKQLKQIINEEVQAWLQESKSPEAVMKAQQKESGGGTIPRSTVRHAEWQYRAGLIMSGWLKGRGLSPGPDQSFWSSDHNWEALWKLKKHGLPWGRNTTLHVRGEEIPGSPNDDEIDDMMGSLSGAIRKGEEALEALRPKMAPLVKKIMATIDKVNQEIEGAVKIAAKDAQRSDTSRGIEYSSPDGMFDKPSSRGGRYQPSYTARGTYQFAEGLEENLIKVIKEEIEKITKSK